MQVVNKSLQVGFEQDAAILCGPLAAMLWNVNNIVHPCSNNIVESLTADEWLIALLTRAPPIEDIHFFVPPSPVEFSLPCGISADFYWILAMPMEFPQILYELLF
jgi:hypothetical protein